MKYQKRKDLKYEAYEAIAERCDACSATGAMANSTGSVRLRHPLRHRHRHPRLDFGDARHLRHQHRARAAPSLPAKRTRRIHIALIGPDIVDNLIGGEDPLGKEIRVDGEPYTVIGVGERKGKTLGQSQDNWVAVPLTTFLETYGANRSLTIYARARGVGDPLELASDQVRVIMRSIRHDPPGGEDTFSIDTNQTFVGIWQSISSSFFAVFVSLAAISLVVGGIVIMNIMLVSVTERTREIGVRKALGARRSDVMSQFLIESATMSFVGGIIGVICGVVLAKLITLIVGFPSDIEIWSVVLGLGVATSVGIFFGVYPARKAAKLDPIVALRAEL